MPIVDQKPKPDQTTLVVVDAGLLHIAEGKEPTANYIRLIQQLAPENSKICFHVPHHKQVHEQRRFLASHGVELVSTPPNWVRSKCSTSISMLSEIFIKAPESSELILISGSADFTLAVQWLWNVHTVPTTVAVPKGVRVSKLLLAVARSFTILSSNESTSTTTTV